MPVAMSMMAENRGVKLSKIDIMSFFCQHVARVHFGTVVAKLSDVEF
jgi:hypothetical protein